MHSRLATLTLALLLATSASAAGAKDVAPSSPQAVGNFLPFDLAVCFLQPAHVEQPINDTALNGLWLLARPLILECLADTRTYIPGKSPAFKISFTVNESGYARTIDSDGLTAAGKKCLDDAMGKVTPPIKPLAPGSKPVTFAEQVPELNERQEVRFGLNEASDVAGTVRVAMPSMCSCFEPFRAIAVPPPIKLVVQVTKDPTKFKAKDGGMPTPVEVTVTDGLAPVRACIADKLSVLTYPTKSDQVQVPYEFLFVNAVAASTDVAQLPDIAKFDQLDAMSFPRIAASQLELAHRLVVADEYNALVKEYQDLTKSNPKKAAGMVKRLIAVCNQLVAQDDAYIAAQQSESSLHKDQLALASSLKAKDAAWGPAEAAAQKAAGDSDALVVKAQELRASDQKNCPKVHY